jgi:hypothetical protein
MQRQRDDVLLLFGSQLLPVPHDVVHGNATTRSSALEAATCSHAVRLFTDLISGQVQVMFCNTVSSVEHIRLHALAVTTAARLDALPDIPT